MKKIIIALVCIWAYKVLQNASRLIRIRHYRDIYKKYSEKQDIDFAVHMPPIVQLFQQAGIPEPKVPYVQKITEDYLCTNMVSLFANLDSIRSDISHATTQCFSKAEGTFRMRLIEAFSPLYWINAPLFLPQKIVSYLELQADTLSCKILQLTYWVLTPLLVVFRDDLNRYIAEFIAKL